MPGFLNSSVKKNIFGYLPVFLLTFMVFISPALGQLSPDDINALKKQAAEEGWTFEITANPATQYSLDELCGLKIPDNWQDMASFDPCTATKALPDSFDWRDVTTLPPVRNQGGCGSCWAFATVGPLECNIKIKDGVIENISEQWLVSCNRDGWDCTGGWFAHDYHEWKNDDCGGHGTVDEADFPYVASDAPCGCPYDHHYTIDDWAYIGNYYSIPSVSAMKQAILDYGPISVALHSNSALQAYGGGIFNGCDGTGSINHAVTIVGWDDNQGSGGVWFVRNSWGTYWGEDGGYARMEYGCSNLGYAACYVDYAGARGLNFDYPDGQPEQLIPGETTTFEVVISPIYESVPISGSGQLHYIINGGTLQTVSMTETSTNHYEATLPALGCEDVIEFYVSAEEQLLGRIYDPDPSAPVRGAAAYNKVYILHDDFESDIGWFVTGNAADGNWERGVPAGDGSRGDPTADYDGSGSCYLTGNTAGDSDVDVGTTILLSPVFDLTDGVGKIEFERWFSNDAGAAPNEDVMKIYVSNAGGSGWVLVDSVGPIEESSGGWYRQEFWPADYVTPTATMMINVTVGDNGYSSVVEAAIDDFTVISYTCTVSNPVIMTESLPDWTVGVGYSRQLIAQGGAGDLSWSDKNNDLVGTGLTLSSDGLLSGTPGEAGSISFTALVTDEAKATDEKLFNFTINDIPTISTTSLPDWTINEVYSQILECNNGTAPFVWSDKNNTLVYTGLSLATDGTISGTPTTSGMISFTAKVEDNSGAADELLFEFMINAAISIMPTPLPDWTVNRYYSQDLDYLDGTAPVSWSDKDNALDGTGLSLSESGLISGVLTSTGTISFLARVTDVAGSVADNQFSFEVNPQIQITTTSLPDWTAGAIYIQTLTCTGGTDPVSWGDKYNSLEGTGLILNSDGSIIGAPMSEGPLSFTAYAADLPGDYTEQGLSFYVNPAVTITTISLTEGTYQETYSFQLESSGGTGTIVWSDKDNDLYGTGLSLSVEGILGGTAMVPGEISFTARAEDIVGGYDETFFTINIIQDFICGDVNSDSDVNIFDATFLISYLYKDGPAPEALVASDVNNDGAVNIFDITYLITFLYSGGPDPNCP